MLPAAGDRPAGGAKSEFTALIRLDAGLQMIQEETLPMVMFFIRLLEQLKNYIPCLKYIQIETKDTYQDLFFIRWLL